MGLPVNTCGATTNNAKGIKNTSTVASHCTRCCTRSIETAVNTSNPSSLQDRWSQLLPWLPIVAGLAGLYIPTLHGLFTTIWASDAQMHGPIVLAISVWLVYRNWPAMLEASQGQQPSAWGWLLVVIALLAYLVGHSQMILLFEVGSVIWLLAGLTLLTYGWRALKAQWFALFFMLFMIPLPGEVVDLVTMPMKMAVSYVAEHVLYAVGYPIGRNGVVLQIGQYMLLVADACAGLHTLLTLEALGLLYLNLVRRDSAFRNIALAVLIVPISFTANVIRVMALSLITYHFGNAAGQGFLHGFAGMVLFLSALLLIISFDSALQFFEGLLMKRKPAPPAPQGA
jgi:exosortase B